MAWFKKKGYFNKEWVFWLSPQLLSEIFLIIRRTGWNLILMNIGLHVKYPLLLSYFKKTWIFGSCFKKIIKYQIPWKSVQWKPSCSMRTDGQTYGQTEMTKLTVAFRNFANAPKTRHIFCLYGLHSFEALSNKVLKWLTEFNLITRSQTIWSKR